MRYILSFIVILMLSTVASAQGEIVKNNDNLYLTLLAVVLTLLFALHGMMRTLLSNPVYIVMLGFVLIIVYILFSAVMIAFGIDEYIDNSILSTVDIIKRLI